MLGAVAPSVVVPVAADTALTDFGLSVAATAVGAVMGTLLVVDDSDYDVTGALLIAACLGFGGGVVRDMLTGTIPPEALRSPWFAVTVVVAAFATIFLHHWFRRLSRLLFLADALVLGLFGAVGAQRALEVGLTPFIAVLLGSVVAVSGGILAALLMGRRPDILMPGRPYALAGLTGVVVFVVLTEQFGVHVNAATAADVVVVLCIRVMVERMGIVTPTPAGITPGILGGRRRRGGDHGDDGVEAP